tara:strand:- start:3228 stop:3719 length:492 start_codon:yes stop_codon:yes gene_type:complete
MVIQKLLAAPKGLVGPLGQPIKSSEIGGERKIDLAPVDKVQAAHDIWVLGRNAGKMYYGVPLTPLEQKSNYDVVNRYSEKFLNVTFKELYELYNKIPRFEDTPFANAATPPEERMNATRGILLDIYRKYSNPGATARAIGAPSTDPGTVAVSGGMSWNPLDYI